VEDTKTSDKKKEIKIDKTKEIGNIPHYLDQLGSYIIKGPHGGGPPNYVIQIDLAKNKEVMQRIKEDPQFKERFNVSIMTPAKLEEVEKMKAGTVAITLKA
jgi:hypothetical protein